MGVGVRARAVAPLPPTRGRDADRWLSRVILPFVVVLAVASARVGVGREDAGATADASVRGADGRGEFARAFSLGAARRMPSGRRRDAHDTRAALGLPGFDGYFQHSSKAVVGSAIDAELHATPETCASKCDSVGYGCAGFSYQPRRGSDKERCYLVGRGYALVRDAKFVFYRKKRALTQAQWETFSGSETPNAQLHAWRGVNGTLADIKDYCESTTQCAGFYTCVGNVNCSSVLNNLHGSDSFAFDGSTAAAAVNGIFTASFDAVLLSGVPEPVFMRNNRDIEVHRRVIRTCEGTAGGASCTFPVDTSVFDDAHGLGYFQFWEPTLVKSPTPGRPWCYTEKPGLWGYTDCTGQDTVGFHWDLNEFSNCSATCGGGLRFRSGACVESSTGENVDPWRCGPSPVMSKRCNDHSCDQGCAVLKLEDRRACGAFYEDPRSLYDSNVIQKETCLNYGCCWTSSPSRGFQCYKSVHMPGNECKNAYDGQLDMRNNQTTTEVTQCGDSCCRGDLKQGPCAWSLGYAHLNDANGPCSRYTDAALSRSLRTWYYRGPNSYIRNCAFILSGRRNSTDACQASCLAHRDCNAINYHEDTSNCGLLDCGTSRRNVGTAFSLGWVNYVYDSYFTAGWHTGDWSKCSANSTSQVIPEANQLECPLWQTRPVSCRDNEGSVVSDDVCIKFVANKPEFERTCFGACNVTRSCEELAWETFTWEEKKSHLKSYDTCGTKGESVGQDWGHGNHSENVAHCKTIGARLCTSLELQQGLTEGAHRRDMEWRHRGTSWQPTWSSTSCANGTGYFMNRWSTLQCERVSVRGAIACCSNYEFPIGMTFREQHTAIRNTDVATTGEGVVLGSYDYCGGMNHMYGPCQVEEGHCKDNEECGFNTQCAIGTGLKYGLRKGSGVCIPTYSDYSQTHGGGHGMIEFAPRKVQPKSSVTMVFWEVGQYVKLPLKASVRIHRGRMQGCMGVHDYSTPIAAETVLKRESDYFLRPADRPYARDDKRVHNNDWSSLPNETIPNMKWHGLTLDPVESVDGEFIDTFYHVCLCDTSLDCNLQVNWNDLGPLQSGSKVDTFIEVKHKVALGGDLFEVYEDTDLERFFPSLNDRSRTPDNCKDVHNEVNCVLNAEIIAEFCAQRCLANPNCVAYDFITTRGGGRRAKDKVCRLRRKGFRLYPVPHLGEYAYARTYIRKSVFTDREIWNFYPGFDSVNRATGKRRNPTLAKMKWTSEGLHRAYQAFFTGVKVASKMNYDNFKGIDSEFVLTQSLGEVTSTPVNGHQHPITGDLKVLDPITYLIHGRYYGTDRKMVYSFNSTEAGTRFKGGVYFPEQKPTCGGNAQGAPCSLDNDALFTDPKRTGVERVGPCFVPKGEYRSMCYTSKDLSRWGYCDCDETEDGLTWSRPFSRWRSTHNAAFRGGEVVLITDTLPGPITDVRCENEHHGENCYFAAKNAGLCLRKQYYPDNWTSWQGFLAKDWPDGGLKARAEIFCPAGEVLTGFAATGYDFTTKGTRYKPDPNLDGSVKEGIMLRCGVPLGFVVSSKPAYWHRQNASKFVSTGRYKQIAFSCPEGSVAIGMKYRLGDNPRWPYGRGLSERVNGAWIGNIAVDIFCARYTMAQGGGPEMKRMCTNHECVGTRTRTFPNITTPLSCRQRCVDTPLCHTFQLDDDRNCFVHVGGLCSVSANPNGIPPPLYPGTHPNMQGVSVVFSPVELNHPVTRGELTSGFLAANVPKSTFILERKFVWHATPWSTCSKPCGNGYQNRTVYCVSAKSALYANRVEGLHCSGAGEKPHDFRVCNSFHCKPQCRADSAREQCYLYQRDERRKNVHPSIRQATCEAHGCCFLEHGDALNVSSREFECYAQPHVDYAEWDVHPWTKCSADCYTKVNDPPIKTRSIGCIMNTGALEDSSSCPIERPVTSMTCNKFHDCPKCGSGCGKFGKCERLYHTWKQWEYNEICRCVEGVHGTRCENTTRLNTNPSWQVSPWREAVNAVPLREVGMKRFRSVSCSRPGACDFKKKPRGEKWVPLAKDRAPSLHVNPTAENSHFTVGWKKSAVATIGNRSEYDYVMHEFRSVGGSRRFIRDTDLPSCLQMCEGDPACIVGIQFEGIGAPCYKGVCDVNTATRISAAFGSCFFIDAQNLHWANFERSETSHLVVKTASLTSYPEKHTHSATTLRKAALRSRAWNQQLTETILLVNEGESKKASTLAETDTIWNLFSGSTSQFQTAQNVSLRKSLYSMAMPVHPNVVKHFRYMKNNLEGTTEQFDLYADVMLALAFKYRNFHSIKNATTHQEDKMIEGRELRARCEYSDLLEDDSGRELRHNHRDMNTLKSIRDGTYEGDDRNDVYDAILGNYKLKMPRYRDESPSPIEALRYLMRKQYVDGNELVFPLSEAPWPLLVSLNTAHYPTKECDWVHDRFKTSIPGSNVTGAIPTRWVFYTTTYTRTHVQCKKSNWHPSALPRLGEDGGICGRMTYAWTGEKSCRGMPAVGVGQPKHSAGIGFNRDASGRWYMAKSNYIFPDFYTTSTNDLVSDDVPGAAKMRTSGIDYKHSLPAAMNIGLDSFIDVRLAIILFRNVYHNDGPNVLNHMAKLLLSALERNPHVIEGWDLLFAHFQMVQITDTSIIEEAYRIFQPFSKKYMKTYEKFLTAVATVYKCTADGSGPLEWLEAELERLSPGCGMNFGQRSIMKTAILPCYREAFEPSVATAKRFEEDILRLAWGRCSVEGYDCDVTGCVKQGGFERTNFEVGEPIVPGDGFVEFMTMVFGGADDNGLAGPDNAAVLDYLEDLMEKVPIANIGPMRMNKQTNDWCDNDPDDPGELDVYGMYLRTGKIANRAVYKKLSQHAEKIYERMGRIEANAYARYWNRHMRLSDPIQLEADGQLAYGKKRDWDIFKRCAGLVSNPVVARRRLLSVASNTKVSDVDKRAFITEVAARDGRMEEDVIPRAGVNEMKAMALDALTGRGLDGHSPEWYSAEVKSSDLVALGDEYSMKHTTNRANMTFLATNGNLFEAASSTIARELSPDVAPSPKMVTLHDESSTLSPSPSPSQEAPASPSPSPREVRILARTIDRLNSSIASKEAWIESAPRVYQEKSKEEKKQRNVYSAALSTMRRLVRKVRWQERKNARLAARGRSVVDLTQTKAHLQTAVSNVSKCKSAWTIARKERKARTTSKIRQAQRNLRALKDQLRRLEGEYAAATSLTPSAGAHLGSVRDRYAYSRYISLLYASTFIIGVAALASVRRRMSSDAVHVAIARGAVPTYGAVDV